MTHSPSKEVDTTTADGDYGNYVHADQMGYLGEATNNDDESGGIAGGGDNGHDSMMEKKEMTELDKYWKAVRDNPQDFTGWTYLLQYVEQENDLEAARRAFDAFFKRYPYCYGYWKKYADLEKKNDNIERCKAVYERGTSAIPLSIDLWQHYITFYRMQYPVSEYEDNVRSIYERSVNAAGLEFRSDRLWEIYIAFELECKNPRNAMAIYDRLIATPTQLYSHHYEKFEEFVRDNHPKDILSADEFIELRTAVVKNTSKNGTSSKVSSAESDGRDSASTVNDKGTADESAKEAKSSNSPSPGLIDDIVASDSKKDDEEAMAIRDKILEVRKVRHKANEEEVSRRWNFEEGIKRPYFHVKPLERSQLKNWRDYLDFELENGSHQRVVVLYERCLIACALYEELWLRYASYMEAFGERGVREVYERACTTHLPLKPNVHLAWASYEEKCGNLSKALEVLDFLEKTFPTYLPATFRRIGLVRRMGKGEKVEALFKKYIEAAPNPQVASMYAIKEARYKYKVCSDFDGAKTVLKKAIINDKDNAKLYLQFVDLCYQATPIDEVAICKAFDDALESEASLDTKLVLAQRKVEFLEDLGSDIVKLQEAYNDLNKWARTGIEKKKRSLDDASDDGSKDKRLRMEMNGLPMTATAMAPAIAGATVAQAAGATDPNAYNYNWAGYAQNYNYPTAAWNMYNQHYYPQQ